MLHVAPTVLVTTTPEVYLVNLDRNDSRPFLRNVPPPANYFYEIYQSRTKYKGIDWYPRGRHHYGLCGDNHRIYISTDEFPSKILEADEEGNVTGCFESPIHRTPPNRIHQMSFSADAVWAVSPTNDAIFRLSVPSGQWEVMPMQSGFAPIPIWDSIHPNSIAHIDQDTWIVCMRDIGGTKMSSLHRLIEDRTECVHEFESGTHVHNVFSLDGDLWVLDSLRGDLLSLGGERVSLGHPDFYLKGVAVTDNHIVVGGIAYKARAERGEAAGIIILLNRSKNVIGHLHLPHGVNDLRVVNQPDYAHSGRIMRIK